MPPRVTIGKPAAGRKSRRRTTTAAAIGSAFLASCCLLLHHHPTILSSNLPPLAVRAETQSTIPRSNNRYTHYNSGSSHSDGSSSGLDTLSSPLNRESYHPPWNPSPKIDPHGFLADYYPRSPGEWEPLANIRGRHGPRNKARYARVLSVPVRIRQVPGDGNCLFHSIAACLHHVSNGTHLPMDSHECISVLRARSLGLRNSAVDILQNSANGGRRRLFLQGEEYLEAKELLDAAAAQFDMAGEEYCELMRKESYWGGGPEIVALCNHLQRPIHIYELIPAEDVPDRDDHLNARPCNNVKTSSQFTLRRMACFGSPKFDRREPLHILSADSRFPDVAPSRIRRVGNHFLALFPLNTLTKDAVEGGGDGGNPERLRRHALIRGGSRISEQGSGSRGAGGAARDDGDGGSDKKQSNRAGEIISKRTNKWSGGQGTWTARMIDWFV
eukprot:CAMPEP_0181100546 /NCGR_PEP_ID=MMETSP1071-20121207/13251_1 /TAXON_ID=35127 /ORGANISM="Thalassiosira sp., Strain NH16" /LENGTH=442 /DNA_ID=CAMNT_0023183283 /DNA_START=115 /DNA_END=1443 /DNA_ORIENTATION=+